MGARNSEVSRQACRTRREAQPGRWFVCPCQTLTRSPPVQQPDWQRRFFREQRAIRRAVLGHAILSFAYNTVILAQVLNLLFSRAR